MTALPMTLETALRYEGYTIDAEEAAELTITTDLGTIVVPAAVRSALTWRRYELDGVTPTTPPLGADLYLSRLPLFNADYAPVLLSSILDMFRTRRIGYNTPGEFRLAVRRWGNLNMRLFNQRYSSVAVAMPLDDISATAHTLDVSSVFPQSLISGSTDYASAANDHKTAHNGRDRSIASLLMEQRNAYLNVDAEVIESFGSLFLGAYDRGELSRPDYEPPAGRLAGFYDSGYSYPIQNY